jgi:hypothetical protein
MNKPFEAMRANGVKYKKNILILTVHTKLTLPFLILITLILSISSETPKRLF